MRLAGRGSRPTPGVLALVLAGCQAPVIVQGGSEGGSTSESTGESTGESAGESAGGCLCEDCDRPNVVLVVMESTRHSVVTPYVQSVPTTPFLDRLAHEGVRVDTAYTVVPHTSKALVAIECGYYPKVERAIAEASEAGLPGPCLATRLSEVGYRTLFIQSATRKFEKRPTLVDNFGFSGLLSKESLPSEGFDESSYFGYEDDIMLAPALAWIDAEQCPFFLSVLTLTAHHDYGVPAGYPARDYVDDPTFNDYLNTVAYTDRFLGKLHAGLEDRGLLEDTIFVVIGDHGEGFGEHGRTQHDNVIWEEGLRVPLILSGPGVPRGRVAEGLFQAIDVAPTIARLVGLDPAPGDGVDLLESAGHERLFFSCWYDDTCMALREGARKVIYHHALRPTEVHDLSADPLETTNVIDEGDNQAFAEAAVAAMMQWKAETNARYEAN